MPRLSRRATSATGRSPHGERGLKLTVGGTAKALAGGSLPARGAWIEIKSMHDPRVQQSSRSPHGERGLK